MEKNNKTEKLTKSKQRVADHGEVFTPEREVNAMLDLVKEEVERIDSRILEPACGNGNFVSEILQRKLKTVTNLYKDDQIKWEKFAILAISSIYGIDILQDNVEECRNRLLSIFLETFEKVFEKECSDYCKNTAAFILDKNIILGDTLSMKVPRNDMPIIFAEWTLDDDNLVKRRDFTFESLVEENIKQSPIPVKEYPSVDIFKIADTENQ